MRRYPRPFRCTAASGQTPPITFWVEHYRYLARAPHLWSIFAPDGTWLGEVDVLGTFDVTDIGHDYVLGVYRDGLDEQSVRM